MRAAWIVTPGGVMRTHSASLAVLAGGTITPILARVP